HQPDRQCKTEYQNDRMLPRGTRDSENIVERHRHVSEDDLPGSLGEGFARDMCGNRSVGIDIVTRQCLGRPPALARSMRVALATSSSIPRGGEGPRRTEAQRA